MLRRTEAPSPAAASSGAPTRASRRALLVYVVVSAKTEKAVELFVRRDDAERFLECVRADEPELAERLRVELVDLDQP